MVVLGHLVSKEGVAVEWSALVNMTEVRSFLGLVGYYQQFVKDFSRIALPITNL